MSEFRHRGENPGPEINWAEVVLLNGENEFSEGEYHFEVKDISLYVGKNISSMMVNLPKFQISVNLNLSLVPQRITVLLGDVKIKDEKEFEIPSHYLNSITPHKISVYWRDNIITECKIDNLSIREI